MAMDGDDGVGGGEETSDPFGTLGDGDDVADLHAQRRKRAVVVAAAVLLVGGTATAMFFSGSLGPPPVVPPTVNAKLRLSVDALEAATRSGDVNAYFSAHQATGDALTDWIGEFSSNASLDTAFTIGGDEVCEGCTLLPKAVKALAGPVPPSVVKNMTQLDKDRFDVKKIQWTIINAFVPAFEKMCDRYVDPTTGKLRPARPD